MKTIRKGVFETNSSSTHSICICTDEELSGWISGDLFYKDDEFCSKEVILYNVREDFPDYDEEKLLEVIYENPWDYGFTYERWGEDYEMDETSYTTKLGEVLHILCYYGQDY